MQDQENIEVNGIVDCNVLNTLTLYKIWPSKIVPDCIKKSVGHSSIVIFSEKEHAPSTMCKCDNTLCGYFRLHLSLSKRTLSFGSDGPLLPNHGEGFALGFLFVGCATVRVQFGSFMAILLFSSSLHNKTTKTHT